jgi:hypothetical protein
VLADAATTVARPHASPPLPPNSQPQVAARRGHAAGRVGARRALRRRAAAVAALRARPPAAARRVCPPRPVPAARRRRGRGARRRQRQRQWVQQQRQRRQGRRQQSGRRRRERRRARVRGDGAGGVLCSRRHLGDRWGPGEGCGTAVVGWPSMCARALAALLPRPNPPRRPAAGDRFHFAPLAVRLAQSGLVVVGEGPRGGLKGQCLFWKRQRTGPE